MSDERLIPDDSRHGVISFGIFMEGKEIRPEYQVMNIVVRKELNKISTVRFTIRDGDAAAEDFEISNTEDFIPGKKVEIKVGRDGQNQSVFKGIITHHGIKIREGGNSELNIECKDESVKLTVGRKSRYFEKKKDSEIIKQIVDENGLSAEIDATKTKHDEVVQHNVTDWDFLMLRADANGLVVLTDDGKIKAFAPDTKSKPVLSLIYGSTLIDFEADMEATYQWKKVEATAWDFKTQKMEKADASSAKFDEAGNLTGKKLSDVLGLKQLDLRHSGKVVKEELKAWADAAMLKSRLAKIRGRCKFFGFSKIKPGDMIEVNGVGKRFNGKVFVTGIQHTLVDGNWFTSAQFGMPMEWFYQNKNVFDAPASGLVASISGLQIGKVVKLEKDPDGEHRVQVKLPVIDPQAKGVWARVATLDAGKKRGSFFRPEIDDEVAVGFVNGDPRDPIIVGMLHSSKLPAPIEAKDDNHEKGFVTRSEMKILFEDDKKIITIETPAGNSIVISEDDKSIIMTDQNKNTITMNDGGIELKSPKDIKLDATGSVEIKAAQDVKIEGLNIDAKAKAEFKADGAAGAKLTTSAIAVVKGSMVQIN